MTGSIRQNEKLVDSSLMIPLAQFRGHNYIKCIGHVIILAFVRVEIGCHTPFLFFLWTGNLSSHTLFADCRRTQ